MCSHGAGSGDVPLQHLEAQDLEPGGHCIKGAGRDQAGLQVCLCVFTSAFLACTVRVAGNEIVCQHVYVHVRVCVRFVYKMQASFVWVFQASSCTASIECTLHVCPCFLAMHAVCAPCLMLVAFPWGMQRTRPPTLHVSLCGCAFLAAQQRLLTHAFVMCAYVCPPQRHHPARHAA